MIVSYIGFTLTDSKTQEFFNKSVARAKKIVSADHDNIIAIRLLDLSDEVELARVYYKDNKVHISYNEEKLPLYMLVQPTDKETNEYVWVVSFDSVWDDEQISNDFRVYANKEDAIKFFKEITENEKKEVDNNLGNASDDWVLDESLSEKYGKGSWEYYMEGYANSNHSYVYLEKKEIRTN